MSSICYVQKVYRYLYYVHQRLCSSDLIKFRLVASKRRKKVTEGAHVYAQTHQDAKKAVEQMMTARARKHNHPKAMPFNSISHSLHAIFYTIWNMPFQIQMRMFIFWWRKKNIFSRPQLVHRLHILRINILFIVQDTTHTHVIQTLYYRA